MFLGTKRILLIATGLIIFLLAGAFIYLELKEEPVIPELQLVGKVPKLLLSGEGKIYLRPSEEGAIPAFVKSETAACGSEIYILDTVFFKEKVYNGYFTDIYKNTRKPEEFIVRLKAPGAGLKAFFILAVPRNNCDRIYLTVAKYETSTPLKGIFVWRVKEKEFRELKVSEEFKEDFVGTYLLSDWKNTVSLDGDKIIVAQPATNVESCDFRILRLLDLRRDISTVLEQLVENETFTYSTYRDEEGFCLGVNIGWLDESTIYYNVYNATVDIDRPLLERRVLTIEKPNIKIPLIPE